VSFLSTVNAKKAANLVAFFMGEVPPECLRYGFLAI